MFLKRVPSLLLTVGLLARAGTPGLLRADEESPEDSPAPSEEEVATGEGEELVVYGELEVARRRRAVDQRLRAYGYKVGVKKEDRTIYRPEVAWKPTVVVHDEGFVIIRRSRVRFEPWVKGRSKAVWLSCIPPLGLMCIKLGGLLVSPARLHAQKGRTLDAMDTPLDAWQEAIMANATEDRLHRQIPDELDALWTDGTRLGGVREAPLADPADRRQAILAFWAGRSCTPEGAEARTVAALFLEYEVQTSPFPVTPAELAAAQASQRCEDTLVLPFPDSTTSPVVPSP